MNETTKKAAAALELLPEDMREPAVAYLIEQAEKYRSLKALVDEGIDDVEARRAAKWDFEDFLRRAKRAVAK
jgi:hypothetical protein